MYKLTLFTVINILFLTLKKIGLSNPTGVSPLKLRFAVSKVDAAFTPRLRWSLVVLPGYYLSPLRLSIEGNGPSSVVVVRTSVRSRSCILPTTSAVDLARRATVTYFLCTGAQNNLYSEEKGGIVPHHQMQNVNHSFIVGLASDSVVGSFPMSLFTRLDNDH